MEVCRDYQATQSAVACRDQNEWKEFLDQKGHAEDSVREGYEVDGIIVSVNAHRFQKWFTFSEKGYRFF
jgi:NAD-dependent DNA ligase